MESHVINRLGIALDLQQLDQALFPDPEVRLRHLFRNQLVT